MASRREHRALERLTESRRQAEQRLSDLWRAVDRELGTWAPRRAAWAIPVVAFACGLAVALAVKGRSPKRDS